jgi:ABC-type lipoprotein release transport system permease subunit
VGTGSYQLIESVAAEILIYSIIGCTIGLVGGIGFSNVLVEIMDTFYPSIQLRGLSLHFSSLTATFLSGILVALISGLYPIFIAISIPVVQNIHSKMGGGNSNGKKSQSWKYTIITGFLLALVGFSLQFFVGPSRFLDFEILSFHFLTVLLIFIGTLFLEIGILVFLPKIAMRMLIGFNIVTRTISTRNIAREFQKSLFTILTSGLALTFIIVVGLVSAAVIAGAPDYFQSQWGNIDLVAETSDLNPLSLTYTNNLELDSRITKSSFIQESRTKISGRDGYVYGVDPTKYADFAETVFDSIDSSIPSDSYLNPLNPNTTNGLISHLLYQKLSIPLGSNVSIKIADNSTVNVTLTCVIKGNLFLGGGEYLYISSTRFQELYQTTSARWFVCDVEGNVLAVEISLQNREIFRDVISITYFAEMMERSLLFQSALFQLLFVESFILAAIAQFICILVSTLRMEREIGIMRSLGLTRRGVFGIFLTESVALGISALFVGLIDGLLGSVLLAEYISNSIPITINFPIMTIATWLFLSFLITIFSTIIPSYRSSRKNIVATISGRPMTKDHFELSPYTLGGLDRSFYRSERFHPASQGSTIDSRLQFDNRVGWSNKPSQSVIENQIESISIYGYIKRNALQIQTVFLILMAAITLNYIFDDRIIMQGLIPFDFIIRLLLPFTNPFIEYNYYDTFLYFNPFFIIIGLAAIIPISYYLNNQEFSISSLRKSVQSLFWGIIGSIILLLTILPFSTIFMEFCIALFMAVNNNPEAIMLSYTFMYFTAFYQVFLYFVLLYLYSMFWGFLIIRGARNDIGFSNQFRLLRRISSRGIIGFFVWLLVHFFLQLVLYLNFIPVSSSFGDMFVPPPDLMVGISLGPIEFLVFAIFEVGFYLFLIIYQLVQLEKSMFVFRPINVQETKEIVPRIANVEIVSRTQTVADEILVKNVQGIKIKHNGQLVFSESINGTRLLFYQENSSSSPVAMNYSRYYPLQQKKISPTDQLSINIPSTSQMQQFLDLSSELKLIPE